MKPTTCEHKPTVKTQDRVRECAEMPESVKDVLGGTRKLPFHDIRVGPDFK